MVKKIMVSVVVLLSLTFGFIYAVELSSLMSQQNHFHEGGLGQKRLPVSFVKDGCGTGTIKDKDTNLCWEQKPSNTGKKHAIAKTYCENLVLGSNSNWRLPQKAELMTLLYHNGAGSTVSHLNSIGFSNIQNDRYWSNTKYLSNNAYVVNFYVGLSSYRDLTGTRYVMCVRSF
jgi:hypothetical protein